VRGRFGNRSREIDGSLLIDIHSHILPAIDDGARTVEQSCKVLSHFVDIGISDLVFTPHVSAWETRIDLEDPLERREAALQTVREQVKESPELHVGFEIMLDSEVPQATLEDGRFSLAGSRYHLVEFKLKVEAETARQLLQDIVEKGRVPIVAHPERYLACSVPVISAWRAVGARFQVDATTLTRPTGRGFRARALLGAGLIDVMAADNHGDSRSVRTGVEFLEQRGAGEQAAILSTANPGAVLADRELEAVPPIVLKESLMERIKRRVKG
jgi:protein-tyrosine phosphatase